MRTTHEHLMHVTIAIGALLLAMTAAMRGAGTPVLAPVIAAVGQTATVTTVPPAPVEDVLPAGVVVDDGVPF
jgi:hypothetical protein